MGEFVGDVQKGVVGDVDLVVFRARRDHVDDEEEVGRTFANSDAAALDFVG